ncbi:cell filamentation protein Fic [Chromatiales bacterium (ex Bugula neritina AB1)]|nr:cell filamentation protein Fic [Chromatiales bacterium (ex Bugula neritina AB1)]
MEPLSREALLKQLGLRDRKSFRERYLMPALAPSWVAMTQPDKPSSRLQRYRLTDVGQDVLVKIKHQ